MNKAMESSPVKRYTGTSLYKTLTRPDLSYGSEVRTLRRSCDKHFVVQSGIREKKVNILKELVMSYILDYILTNSMVY